MDQVKYVLKNIVVKGTLESLVNEALEELSDKEIIDIKFQTSNDMMSVIVQIHYRDRRGHQ